MAEDDGTENPYEKFKTNQPQYYEGWNEGDEHGQLHPSPETVKKIQNEAVANFAEKMKGAITHAIREKRAVTPIPISYDELMEIIDNTLKQEGDD